VNSQVSTSAIPRSLACTLPRCTAAHKVQQGHSHVGDSHKRLESISCCQLACYLYSVINRFKSGPLPETGYFLCLVCAHYAPKVLGALRGRNIFSGLSDLQLGQLPRPHSTAHRRRG